MSSVIDSINFDCTNPLKVARFWAAALNFTLTETSDETDAEIFDPKGKGISILFFPVPEGKVVKNRVHLDLTPSDSMAAEVERLIALGAQKVQLFSGETGTWTVMRDPEGNEFCVLRSLEEKSKA
jgi:hypothetical protein